MYKRQIVYQSLQTVTQVGRQKNPTLQQFMQLFNDDNVRSLTCPCSKAVIKYEDVDLFVQPVMFELCNVLTADKLLLCDVRRHPTSACSNASFADQARGLYTLCQLASQTIQTAKEQFRLQPFSSPNLLDPDEWDNENFFIAQRLLVAIQGSFGSVLDLANLLNHINRPFAESMNPQLGKRTDYSADGDNYILDDDESNFARVYIDDGTYDRSEHINADGDNDGSYLGLPADYYSSSTDHPNYAQFLKPVINELVLHDPNYPPNSTDPLAMCDCYDDPTCSVPLVARTDPFYYLLQGQVEACYVYDSILQSSIDIFYSQDIFDEGQPYATLVLDIAPLHNQTSFNLTAPFSAIVAATMLESIVAKAPFDVYYAQCNVRSSRHTG